MATGNPNGYPYNTDGVKATRNFLRQALTRLPERSAGVITFIVSSFILRRVRARGI